MGARDLPRKGPVRLRPIHPLDLSKVPRRGETGNTGEPHGHTHLPGVERELELGSQTLQSVITATSQVSEELADEDLKFLCKWTGVTSSRLCRLMLTGSMLAQVHLPMPELRPSGTSVQVHLVQTPIWPRGHSSV